MIDIKKTYQSTLNVFFYALNSQKRDGLFSPSSPAHNIKQYFTLILLGLRIIFHTVKLQFELKKYLDISRVPDQDKCKYLSRIRTRFLISLKVCYLVGSGSCFGFLVSRIQIRFFQNKRNRAGICFVFVSFYRIRITSILARLHNDSYLNGTNI